MTQVADPPAPPPGRELFLKVLAGAMFLLFFQTFMVAPLIPTLAGTFDVSRQTVGLLVPAYTIPYALSALVCGAVGDRVGRRGLWYVSLAGFVVFAALTALSPNVWVLLAMRAAAGAANVGMVVMGLSLIGDLYPDRERGHAIGWAFGAIAGGSAFGSTAGGLLAPLVGWRGLFLIVAGLGVVVLAIAWRVRDVIKAEPKPPTPLSDMLGGYVKLLKLRRARRTYAYIFANAVFHSGVFTWLGVYLHDRFGLGEMGIGLALLGYGVPGLVFGPLIGKAVDRYGRRRFIPAGLAAAALSAALLVPHSPLWVFMAVATLLSFGFDMSHPLLAGIATTLDDQRRAQAMGMNTFAIFLGFGLGSIVFGALSQKSMTGALAAFAAVQFVLAAGAVVVFRAE